jgi:hypothetical protein
MKLQAMPEDSYSPETLDQPVQPTSQRAVADNRNNEPRAIYSPQCTLDCSVDPRLIVPEGPASAAGQEHGA